MFSEQKQNSHKKTNKLKVKSIISLFFLVLINRFKIITKSYQACKNKKYIYKKHPGKTNTFNFYYTLFY